MRTRTLDECVPARLKRAFPGHSVQTVTETGWRTSKDAPLLVVAQESFDVFVTVDRKLETENDLKKFRLGFVVAHVPTNRLDSFEPIFGDMKLAAENVRPREVIHVISPRLRSHR